MIYVPRTWTEIADDRLSIEAKPRMIEDLQNYNLEKRRKWMGLVARGASADFAYHTEYMLLLRKHQQQDYCIP